MWRDFPARGNREVSAWEKLNAYGRFLLTKLLRRSSGAGYELEDEVALRFYRLQKIKRFRHVMKRWKFVARRGSLALALATDGMAC